MEKYENLGMLGEGSYGMVMKCKHKETGQVVAIKKFLETEDDKMVKKIALREVKMLKQLRHENLVNLLEVFRRKKRLYLVFEFVDRTALDDLERFPAGAEENHVKKIMWQVLKGVEFCHLHNIIHRDVKPENILISRRGVVKICDFGFARTIAPPGEVYTDYVATRWYRAPELLVGDTSYGRAVDVWAVGCLFSEMLTGEPLFPGESDIDQLHLITKCFGNLIGQHREIFRRNPLFIGMRLPEARELEALERRYPQLSPSAMDIIKWSLRLDPHDRPTCSQLLRHEMFTMNSWTEKFAVDLRSKIEKEFDENPLIKNLGITIYGSVHEARQREMAERKARQEVAQVHSEVAGGHETKTSDADGRIRRKERRKKPKKDPLLTREKAPRGLLHTIETRVPISTTTVPAAPEKLPLTSSQTSLTASQTHLLSSRTQTPRRQLPPTPHSPSQTTTTLPPMPHIAPQSEGVSSHLTYTSTHHHYPSHPHVSTPPIPHKNLASISFKSPPTSRVNMLSLRSSDDGAPNASSSQSGMKSTHSPDTNALHSDSKQRYIPLNGPPNKPDVFSSHIPHASQQQHNAAPSFKKLPTKSKDPLLFPYFKDKDKQHSKLSPHGAHFGMSVLNNTSQTGTPPTDKSYLLTSIPHLSQLDKLKTSTPPKTQHNRTVQPEASTT